MENGTSLLCSASNFGDCFQNTEERYGKYSTNCGYFRTLQDGACVYAFPLWIIIALSSLCGVLLISLLVVVIVWRVREAK